MADELTFNANIRFAKGGFDTLQQAIANNKKFTVTGVRAFHAVQQAGFAARELIDLGECTALGGVLVVRNLDGTNFVQVFHDATAGIGVAKLLPGKFCIIPLDTEFTTPALKADTSACNCEIIFVEL